MPPPRKAKATYLTLERLHWMFDPSMVYYRPVVDHIIQQGDVAELKALIAGVKALKVKYADFDGVINAAEMASRKATSA